MKTGYLVLADGQVFQGLRFGAEADTVGELVFTTGMCGYVETLTDPSYAGQIVLQTYPLIGNCGIIPEDFEGDCHVRGYVVRERCEHPSNFRCQGDLEGFLRERNVPSLCGVDTRQLTRIIRESGVMNAMICDDAKNLPQKLAAIKKFKVERAVEETSCASACTVNVSDAEHKYKVVLYDFGAKLNIERELISRGCAVVRVPFDTTAEQALAYAPDGIMLSNGGGNPADNTAVIAEIAKLCKSGVPMFGICLGHQLMALANGASTVKLKYGHRGGNQPVKDLVTGRTYITSQNHGYAVKGASVDPAIAAVRFVNANDKTVEGIDYLNAPAFSVQFHPEACGGPKDTEFLFERFIKLMEEYHAGR